MRPYLGVSCLVFNALNKAFSAPRICTVLAGCFARLINEPVNRITSASKRSCGMGRCRLKRRSEEAERCVGCSGVEDGEEGKEHGSIKMLL